jgi:isopenicillin-N epimerase
MSVPESGVDAGPVRAGPTVEPPAPLEDSAGQFCLDPAIDYLNHGCFGARPRAVSVAQGRYREAFERHPIQWLDPKDGRDVLAEAKATVGAFLGMEPDGFGFVSNATGGVNAVLRSLPLGPGDELLTTTHVYPAVRQTLRFLLEQRGAAFRELELPLPLSGDDAIVDAVIGGLSPKTRLVIVDHVTSPTAIVFPVQRIAAECAARGVDVLVDGAHAPGMLPLDVASIGAAYYAGNLHKWVCAPVGAAFIRVRPDRRQGIHPNTISHYLDEGFAAEFGWQGTMDITPWLCAADAIEYFERWGWDRVRAHNHALAVWAGAMLARRWNVTPIVPADGAMLGSMATVALPASLRAKYGDPIALQNLLYTTHRFELPVVDWGDAWWVRMSAQVYNRPEQYERLAEVVTSLA